VNAVVHDEDEVQFIVVPTHGRLSIVENLSVEVAALLTVASHDLWMKCYTGAFFFSQRHTVLDISNYGCCNVNNLTIWTILERFRRYKFYLTVVINFVACCYKIM